MLLSRFVSCIILLTVVFGLPIASFVFCVFKVKKHSLLLGCITAVISFAGTYYFLCNKVQQEKIVLQSEQVIGVGSVEEIQKNDYFVAIMSDGTAKRIMFKDAKIQYDDSISVPVYEHREYRLMTIVDMDDDKDFLLFPKDMEIMMEAALRKEIQNESANQL